jgi:hypothetical protein
MLEERIVRERLVRQAERYGPEHPLLAMSLEELAVLLRKLERPAEAADLIGRGPPRRGRSCVGVWGVLSTQVGSRK